MKRKSREHVDSDRERILVNIAGMLAAELASIQALPSVQGYMQGRSVRAEWFRKEVKKGDLVACGTSVGRQQNPWIVSFVEDDYREDMPQCLLRAIGTGATCNYGNESFTRISGIPERLLWEFGKREFDVKLHKAFRRFDMYFHCFRGLEFPKDGLARIFIGERFGGIGKRTKPYTITVDFSAKTTIKNIATQLAEQGLGKRTFEDDDGQYEGPMQGLTTFTRETLVNALKDSGIELKK